jgi:threonine synthase
VVEAQKTIAYETVEQFGVPDWFIVSMGSGETIYSIWKGFKELQKMKVIDALPRMVGVQSAGCAPLVNAYFKPKTRQKRNKKIFTHALAILVKNPLYDELALKTIQESNGKAVAVSDKEIFTAEQEVARLEGIFAEPSSSATIAALKKLVNRNIIRKEETVVCLITGSGLKATDVLQTLTKKRKATLIGLELSTKEKILRIISHKETYGYALWEKLGKTMTRGAVYQHLNELSRKGLITAYEKEGKKIFKLTRRGRRVLRAVDELKVLL